MSKDQAGNDSILLMNHDRILRTIERMAYQIDEDHREGSEILIAGLKTRGMVVAQCLSGALSELTSHSIYQVHLPALDAEPEVMENESYSTLPQNFDYTLVVDDVIFSGQTMFRAIENIRAQFNTKMLRSAVLIDRGHRNLPVEASFVGMHLPTKLDEHVAVCVKNSLLEKVILTKRSDK
jgi:pyrimidine operon attenuation protein/uracil phosphoribosyltransferase